jgi:predicted subunit of tRNA(5-methylaminomethyl-2-thiouridylate) methyltransferase
MSASDGPRGAPDDGDCRETIVVLFSGGKDSALAARLLDPIYDVGLAHCRFGIETGVGETAAAAASALDLPLATVDLDVSVAREAVERMVADGYPRRGIQRVHEHALETVAAHDTLQAGGEPWYVQTLADGIRRDDRVPTVERAFAQRLEDRHTVDYIRPLLGYGRGAVDRLVERLVTVETGPSETVATADYETELRAVMGEAHGEETVADVFPDHSQSRVTGR